MAHGEDIAKFNLQWKSYTKVLSEGIAKLLLTGQFADITLSCREGQIKCHRFILSIFSPLLAEIIEQLPNSGVIFLGNGIRLNHLQTLLSFMYTGEAVTTQHEMPGLLKTAEELKIRGLTILNNNNATTAQETDTDDGDLDSTTSVNSTGHNGVGTSMDTNISRAPSPTGVLRNMLPTSSSTSNRDENGRSGGELAVANGTDNVNSGQEAGRIQEEDTLEGIKLENVTSEEDTPRKSARNKKQVNQTVGSILMEQETESGDATAIHSTNDKKNGQTKRQRLSSLPSRPSPYGENMRKALDQVSSGIPLGRTSVDFGIPISTLSKYVKNPEKIKTSKMYYFPGA